MWELDHLKGWAPKKWYFWTVVLRRLLRVSWTARRSNQSILKEINPKYSLEDWCWTWSSNTLATWSEEPTHCKRPCWKRLKARGEGGKRGITHSMDMSLNKFREIVKNREAWLAVVRGIAKSQTWLSKWTTVKYFLQMVAVKCLYIELFSHCYILKLTLNL